MRQQFQNLVQQLDSVISMLSVPTTPDLSTLDGATVARMWVDNASNNRRALESLKMQIVNVFEQVGVQAAQAAAAQAPVNLPHAAAGAHGPGVPVFGTPQGNAEIVRYAKELFAASSSAPRMVAPQESIDRAKAFWVAVEQNRLT